jgi:hypothetical protein
MPNEPSKPPTSTDAHHSGEPVSVRENPCPKTVSDKDSYKTNFGKIHWGIVNSAFLGVAALVVASTLIFAMSQWIRGEIDKSVEAKFSDEKVLRQIAAQVRPALIFDENESITVDMGAVQYIKGIQIIKREADGWPTEISVDFNRYFATAPILTSMYEVTFIIPKRGKGLAWDFDIHEIVSHEGMETNLWAYRLELTP